MDNFVERGKGMEVGPGSLVDEGAKSIVVGGIEVRE
jgi:hypothetical protein